jgi:hypothetical protein
MKKICLQALLTVVMPLIAACSVADEDSSEPTMSDNNNVAFSGIYEGEWTVNSQVVDTARLVVTDNLMQLRLPEEYLLSTYILPHLTDHTGSLDYHLGSIPTGILIEPQGYSQMSQYMSFASPTIQESSTKRWYKSCSFYANIGGILYQIDLLSEVEATAVKQNTTGQWTLGIPIDGFLLTNLLLSTHESERIEQPYSFTIYYNTKRRIR